MIPRLHRTLHTPAIPTAPCARRVFVSPATSSRISARPILRSSTTVKAPEPRPNVNEAYQRVRLVMDAKAATWDALKGMSACSAALSLGVHFAGEAATKVLGYIATSATLFHEGGGFLWSAFGLAALTGFLWNHARPYDFIVRNLKENLPAETTAQKELRSMRGELESRRKWWSTAGIVTVLGSMLPLFYMAFFQASLPYALPIFVVGSVVGALGIHQASRYKKARETIEDVQGILKLDLFKILKRGFLNNFTSGRLFSWVFLGAQLPIFYYAPAWVTAAVMFVATAIGLKEYVYNLMFKDRPADGSNGEAYAASPTTRKVVYGLGMASAALLALQTQFGPQTLFAVFLPLVAAASYFVLRAEMESSRKAAGDYLRAIGGITYVPLLFAHFHFLRQLPGGESWLLGAILLSIVADTSAMGVGSAAKGWGALAKRPFPEVSPNKTYAGFVGGTLGVFAAATGLSLWLLGGSPEAALRAVGLGLIGLFGSTFGDLFESMFKRAVGEKDAGTFLRGRTLQDPWGRDPALKGWGGILDRLDSHAFVVGGVYYWMTFIEPKLVSLLGGLGLF